VSAKFITGAIGVITAAAGIIARFYALEEFKQIQVQETAAMRITVQTMHDRVLSLEAKQATLERMHELELRLARIEEQLKAQEERRRR